MQTHKNMNNMVKDLLARVRSTICNYEMLQAGDKVVVAVSGGPDSVCLLDVLHTLKEEFQIKLAVAHFDHGLRPGEDEKETNFVRHLAHSYGIEFYSAKATSNLANKEGSLEELAREERYQFLKRIQRQAQAQKIALGHQLNDQAETVLLRLLRGSGTLGLAAIPPVRDRVIIRPLIRVSRKQIIAYLVQKGLKWMEDSSNFSTIFMRNRVRQELIPLLKSYQPNILEILANTAEIIREDDNLLNQLAEDWLNRNTKEPRNSHLCISIKDLSQLPKALQRRVLRCSIKKVSSHLRKVSWSHLELVRGLVFGKGPQAEVHLPCNLVVKKRYGKIIIAPKTDTHLHGYWYTIRGFGVRKLENINSTIEVTDLNTSELKNLGLSPYQAFLDAAKVTFPLIVRPFQPGDRFMPLGMKGTKKVHDLFIDMKLPLELRRSVPIVCCGESIVWVAGLRIDDRFKITQQSKKVLMLKICGAIVEELKKWRK